ncbi:CLAVATA3/ESR (CLE)-related protein TDIF-like [Gastrolobium bilobum]|uniref:CLAVATA3/ESR (CLE)-related protein TDIF-like n=1 Tax=Gastrolobium bilobum TaxID=150636 RepID=UPI002AB1699B|nr:CLAVATA3/ESR (CLE)-related protein TDIF-like [Gastrolobium bilobum]
MDIELLWALGGWFLLSNCMAEPAKTSSPISEAFSKNSHSFMQFLTFLFIALLLIDVSQIPNPSVMASSQPMMKSSESTMCTTKLHPQKTQNSPSSSKDAEREFGVEAHEVPSGPNPIQNR